MARLPPAPCTKTMVVALPSGPITSYVFEKSRVDVLSKQALHSVSMFCFEISTVSPPFAELKAMSGYFPAHVPHNEALHREQGVGLVKKPNVTKHSEHAVAAMSRSRTAAEPSEARGGVVLQHFRSVTLFHKSNMTSTPTGVSARALLHVCVLI